MFPVIMRQYITDSSCTCYWLGLYSMSSLYLSPGKIDPVPVSVQTWISLGSLTNENCWGKRLRFSISTVALDALWLKIVPKSIWGGWKIMALTEKQARIVNFTGSTWFAPTTLIGILIVNSSNSSLFGLSSYFTKYLLQAVRIDLSGLNFSHISN